MNAKSSQPNPLIAGYHSRRAYSYPEEHSHAIIKTTAYHRKDFDLAVIWFPAHTHSGVVASLAADYRKPTASLGELDKLPLELITNICLQLDIKSLLHLRQVNARGQQIVNTIHEYRVIIKHALNAFLALLRTRKTPGVTLGEFYSLLHTKDCHLCGKYGNLVYLPTWIRCCSSCLSSDNRATNMRSLYLVKRFLSLSQDSLQDLPKIETIPGIYTMDQSSYRQRITYVPARHVIAAHEKECGDEIDPRFFSDMHRCSASARGFTACCALPNIHPQNGQVEYGVSCAGCQIVLANVVNRLHRGWAGAARDTVYSHNEYLEHFAWCEQAQLLWEESAHSTREPKSLPSFCKKGGSIERCSAR